MGVRDATTRRRVTMRDIAEAAQVPVSAVGLALNDKPGVSPARREIVLRVARELGYGPPKTTDGRIVGLIVEELAPEARVDGFIDSIVQGVYTGARESGTRVLLNVYHPGTDPIEELRSLVGRHPDGLLLTNGGDISPDVIASITATGMPVVLVENHVGQPVPSVVADNFQAGYAATRHLIDLGHRRIGIVRGSDRYISLKDRARGYLAALWEAGITPERDLMPEQAVHTARKGYDQTLTLLDQPAPPTAIYAVSDKSALGTYAAISERGLRIPEDISVAGTDNVEESAYRSPPLTTFDVRPHLLGREAVRKLLAVMDGDDVVTRTIIQGHLELRASTALRRGAEQAR